MEPINYRNVTEQDYPQVSEMLCGIWQFDKYLKDAEIVRRAGLAFWYAYLARQNYAEVAERGGRILGVLLGHCVSLPFPAEHLVRHGKGVLSRNSYNSNSTRRLCR